MRSYGSRSARRHSLAEQERKALQPGIFGLCLIQASALLQKARLSEQLTANKARCTLKRQCPRQGGPSFLWVTPKPMVQATEVARLHDVCVTLTLTWVWAAAECYSSPYPRSSGPKQAGSLVHGADVADAEVQRDG